MPCTIFCIYTHFTRCITTFCRGVDAYNSVDNTQYNTTFCCGVDIFHSANIARCSGHHCCVAVHCQFEGSETTRNCGTLCRGVELPSDYSPAFGEQLHRLHQATYNQLTFVPFPKFLGVFCGGTQHFQRVYSGTALWNILIGNCTQFRHFIAATLLVLISLCGLIFSTERWCGLLGCAILHFQFHIGRPYIFLWFWQWTGLFRQRLLLLARAALERAFRTSGHTEGVALPGGTGAHCFSFTFRCRSGPKSRRHPLLLLLLGFALLLLCRNQLPFMTQMDDWGEGCGLATETAEVSSSWIEAFIQTYDTKQRGIQPTFYGSRLPWRSTMTPVVKRSMKRAYRRSCRDGLSWYRGQCFAPQDFPCFSPRDLHSPDGQAAKTKPTPAEVEQFNSRNQDRRRLRVLNWNCGGLAVAKLDEIKLWLMQQRIDVAILTETRWTYEGESQDSHWYSIHTGSSTHRGMGILCLISTRLCKQDQLRWRSVVEGRLLHIQLRLGNRNTDIIGCYQFTQASHKARQQDRERWWTSLDQLLGTLARRNMLVLAGDFNCCLPQAHSYTGPAEFRWRGSLTTGSTHMDSGRFLNVIKTHGLVALNTWNINLGPSFAHANHCSRIDFLIARKPFADGVAKM